MKILVIGGNRFFGKRLVRKLVDHKHDVTILNRGNISDDFLETVKRINVDRSNQTAFLAAIQDNDWDIVYDQVWL